MSARKSKPKSVEKRKRGAKGPAKQTGRKPAKAKQAAARPKATAKARAGDDLVYSDVRRQLRGRLLSRFL